MQELYGVYAVAAGLIGIMLILCFDIVRRNKEMVETLTNKENKPSKQVLNQDKLPVYPLYIDCSSDLIKKQMGYDSAEQPMSIKQGA